MPLPVALYRAAHVRELDRLVIEKHGIAGITLMERAGQAAFDLLRTRWPRARKILVICGPGNNGGDGYVIARLARDAGLAPVVLTVGESARARGDAATARVACQAAGVAMHDFASEQLKNVDVIVDAILGTGLERDVEGAFRVAIESANEAPVPVLALDIPSGLNADAGRIMGAAVRAHATITFIGLKAGLFTGSGREHSGEIVFAGLGVPVDIYSSIVPLARRITERSLLGVLPPRARDGHKGSYGHVLVVGGNQGMPGAAHLAGAAAYRAGAGLVSVATHPAHAAWLNATRPELLVQGVRAATDLQRLFARANVVALGPGLGQDGWAQALFSAVIEARLPLVLDADALNLLAVEPCTNATWILTPHPGEAARLLGVSTCEIQADRFGAVTAIAARYGGVCVLKGSGSLVASPGESAIALCDLGNPGMASGGMGDVLTGVIAASLAQGLSPPNAARLGVWVHAAAGDDAARVGGGALSGCDPAWGLGTGGADRGTAWRWMSGTPPHALPGEIGLLASDLLPFIRNRMNGIAAYAPG